METAKKVPEEGATEKARQQQKRTDRCHKGVTVSGLTALLET